MHFNLPNCFTAQVFYYCIIMKPFKCHNHYTYYNQQEWTNMIWSHKNFPIPYGGKLWRVQKNLAKWQRKHQWQNKHWWLHDLIKHIQWQCECITAPKVSICNYCMLVEWCQIILWMAVLVFCRVYDQWISNYRATWH